MSDVTRVLCAYEAGDVNAPDAILPLVYDELRRLAAAKIDQERGNISLQATALVHEAYVRLVDTDQVQRWDSRRHFFAAAAEAMRRILVERARRRKAAKHGGDRARIHVQLNEFADSEATDELLALNEALDALKTHDSQACQLVLLRYFGGLGHHEAATAMGIGRRTADRVWAIARVWLHDYIRDQNSSHA